MISTPPKRILMIKSHSMGVGDVLRSSAAWRAMTDQWPGVELHLLFLSKHAGYATEELIQRHHLLSSAHFVIVRAQDPSVRDAKRVPIRQIMLQVQAISRAVKPDLVIDFEPNGMKTSWVTWMAAKACGAQTVGIAQFPGRSWFYDRTSPSLPSYAQSHGLTLPMDYTHRDFVVLQALGIERKQTAIELRLTPEAEAFKQSLLASLPKGLPVVGLNIGCATQGAASRRPDLQQLAYAIQALGNQVPHCLVLSGAPFEADINQAFMKVCQSLGMDLQRVVDCSGRTSLSTLAGLIDACDLFISSDSGPYHVSVALHQPTLCWFNSPDPAANHQETWVRCLVKPTPAAFVEHCQQLMASNIPQA